MSGFLERFVIWLEDLVLDIVGVPLPTDPWEQLTVNEMEVLAAVNSPPELEAPDAEEEAAVVRGVPRAEWRDYAQELWRLERLVYGYTIVYHSPTSEHEQQLTGVLLQRVETQLAAHRDNEPVADPDENKENVDAQHADAEDAGEELEPVEAW